MELVHGKRFVLSCLVAGVLVRLLWICIVDADQVSDFLWYYLRAVSIALGTGYTVDGIPTAYWPVGYPGFLGITFHLFGPSLFLAKCINIVLYAGLILLTYWIGRKIFQSELAARLMVLLLSFYPNHIAYTSLLSAEILFAFLVLLGAALLILLPHRTPWLLLSGLVWGMATLTKPQAVLLPIILLSVFSRNRKSLFKAAAVVYALLFITISPWIIRNYFALGKPTLSTNAGIVLFIGNNPHANGRDHWDEKVKSQLGELGTDDMFDGREVEREALATRLAVSHMVHHPVRTLSVWPRKFVALFASDVDGFFYSLGMMDTAWAHRPFVYVGLRVIGELYYLCILLLAALALLPLLRRRTTEWRIGLYIALYFTATYLVFEANARYHFAFMPWLVMYAGIGGAPLLERTEVGSALEECSPSTEHAL